MVSFLRQFTTAIDQLNTWVGRAVSWLLVLMVVVTFVIVILRYFFNLGWVWMQETVLYMHGAVFLLAASFTLLKDGHVRVDVFYRKFNERQKAIVNLLGSFLLLMPVCLVIFYEAFPFVVASWRVFEGSKDGGGIEAVFLQKTMILVFCLLMVLQGLSLMGKSYLTLTDKSHA